MSGSAPGSGLLAVDKPEGPTSHDIVGAARRALGTRRVGHAGTLDPFASGLLLLGVERGTRLIEYVAALDKTYEATARLGITTTTLDPEGAVVSESTAWDALGREDVAGALRRREGVVRQLPPVYSAKKVDGERSYRRARRGEAVALEPVEVTIHSAELTDFRPPLVHFRVRCSTGTYIRAIARDMGEELGVGAHLTTLRRTTIGRFGVDRAVAPDRMEDPEEVRRAWISPPEALRHLPRVDVDDDLARRMIHGQSPDRTAVPGLPDLPDGTPVTVHRGEELICVARPQGNRLRPRKVLATLEDLAR